MSMHILLVDDDIDDIDLFREAVSEIDSTICCDIAYNGKEALDKLSAEEVPIPGLIFLDVNMPKMNGWDCLAALKHAPAYKHIPVIMYSTSTNAREDHLAGDSGALHFFVKPNDYFVLRSILATIIAHLKQERFKIFQRPFNVGYKCANA